jgi:hypothetical protein
MAEQPAREIVGGFARAANQQAHAPQSSAIVTPPRTRITISRGHNAPAAVPAAPRKQNKRKVNKDDDAAADEDNNNSDDTVTDAAVAAAAVAAAAAAPKPSVDGYSSAKYIAMRQELDQKGWALEQMTAELARKIAELAALQKRHDEAMRVNQRNNTRLLAETKILQQNVATLAETNSALRTAYATTSRQLVDAHSAALSLANVQCCVGAHCIRRGTDSDDDDDEDDEAPAVPILQRFSECTHHICMEDYACMIRKLRKYDDGAQLEVKCPLCAVSSSGLVNVTAAMRPSLYTPASDALDTDAVSKEPLVEGLTDASYSDDLAHAAVLFAMADDDMHEKCQLEVDRRTDAIAGMVTVDPTPFVAARFVVKRIQQCVQTQSAPPNLSFAEYKNLQNAVKQLFTADAQEVFTRIHGGLFFAHDEEVPFEFGRAFNAVSDMVADGRVLDVLHVVSTRVADDE